MLQELAEFELAWVSQFSRWLAPALQGHICEYNHSFCRSLFFKLYLNLPHPTCESKPLKAENRKQYFVIMKNWNWLFQNTLFNLGRRWFLVSMGTEIKSSAVTSVLSTCMPEHLLPNPVTNPYSYQISNVVIVTWKSGYLR